MITYVKADDWAGIYVNGDLWAEGHSISDFEWIRLLRLIGVSVHDQGETDKAYRAIEAEGRCPRHWPPVKE